MCPIRGQPHGPGGFFRPLGTRGLEALITQNTRQKMREARRNSVADMEIRKSMISVGILEVAAERRSRKKKNQAIRLGNEKSQHPRVSGKGETFPPELLTEHEEEDEEGRSC